MRTETVRIFVGFDEREAAAYHVFCQSVIDHSSLPVAFHPLHKGLLANFDGQRDGSNAFIFSRYLVPYLCDFNGFAIFCDGDMAVTTDIADLWEYRHDLAFNKAVAVVKHEYKTKHPFKYLGTPLLSRNLDYPRKNWSSVMLWNCNHYANRKLTPDYVESVKPEFIHRFGWLEDDQIADLPSDWNRLVGEDPPGPGDLFHYTLGVPGIPTYADDSGSWNWHRQLIKALSCAGVDPVKMVKQAQDRVGE